MDDVPWLDVASRHVLHFAMRRLQDEPIGLLVTARTADGSGLWAMTQLMPTGYQRAVQVDPLSIKVVAADRPHAT